MTMKPELVEEDRDRPGDLRTMREIVRLGSSINPDVQLPGDCPCKHTSGNMPVLDTQLWLKNGKVMFEHYLEPMAGPLVMPECSVMPVKDKFILPLQVLIALTSFDCPDTFILP